jgi:hypothetical protein
MLRQSYTAAFKQSRKLVKRELDTVMSAAQPRDAQEREVGKQLVNTLREPDGLLEHFGT